MNTITYQGINPQIVATAQLLASKAVTSLNVPKHEKEDIIQQLLIAGVRIEQEFKPGTRSLSSFLTERMQNAQKDILRFYRAHKRSVYLYRLSENEREDAEGNLTSIFDLLTDRAHEHDIVGTAQVHDVLNSLSGQERTLAELLLQGYTSNEAARKMNTSLRTVESLKAKIRKKLS